MAAKDLKDKIEQEYIVLHTSLDQWFKGQRITLAHLKAGLDREIDLDRLVRLGAIAPVDSEEGKAAAAATEAGATTPAGDPVAAEVPLPTPDITNTKATDDAKPA